MSSVHPAEELNERVLDFCVRVLRASQAIRKSPAGRHVATQLLRCGTAPGANYEEACGAESAADFVHKLAIVVKELKETRFWLRLSQRAELVAASKLVLLLKETNELIAIFSKSIATTRKGRIGPK